MKIFPLPLVLCMIVFFIAKNNNAQGTSDESNLTNTQGIANLPITTDSIGGVFVPNQVIVNFDNTTSPQDRAIARATYGAILEKSCNCFEQLELWRFGDDTVNPNTIDDTITDEMSCVDSVDPNYVLEYDCYPFPDFTFDFNPPHDSSAILKIAMVDTGIKNILGLEDFICCKGSMDWNGTECLADTCGFDFVYGLDPASPDNHYHATHMSSYLLNNLAPGVAVQFLNYKAFDNEGKGKLFDAVCAIYYAIENQVDIINASWSYRGAGNDLLEQALQTAAANDILTVVASGNGIGGVGQNIAVPETAFYPAAYAINKVISIGAFQENQLTRFSNYNDPLVDFVAPGWKVQPWKNAMLQNGTSYATAYVSALAASHLYHFPTDPVNNILSCFQNAATPFGNILDGKLDVLSLSFDIEHIACNGDLATSSITVHAQGGVPPYSYAWDTGVSSPTISFLNAGDYIVTVTDKLGYQITDTATVLFCPIIAALPADTIVYADSLSCHAILSIAKPTIATDIGTNHALHFDGINDFVVCPDFNIGTVDFRVELWIFPEMDGLGSEQILFSNYNVNPDNNYSLVILPDGRFGMAVQQSGLSMNLMESQNLLDVNCWNKLTITRLGTDFLFELNDNQGAAHNTAFVYDFAGSSSNIYFGGTPFDGGFNFKGAIDEFTITPLPEVNENGLVGQFYNNNFTGGYYGFNQGTICGNNFNETILQGQPNGFQGELINFALDGENPATFCQSNWVRGAYLLQNDYNNRGMITGEIFFPGITTITWTTTDPYGSTTTGEMEILVIEHENCVPVETCGCTDNTAHNYNPDATTDSGYCETCSDGVENGGETGVDCGGILCSPCSACPQDTLTLTGNINPAIYEDIELIITNGIILNNNVVTFEAADAIILNAGFTVEAGTYFDARIVPCNQ